MFSFFKKKPPPAAPVAQNLPAALPATSLIGSALVTPIEIAPAGTLAPERERWLVKLTSGLRKTGSSISAVFGGTQIDDAL